MPEQKIFSLLKEMKIFGETIAFVLDNRTTQIGAGAVIPKGLDRDRVSILMTAAEMLGGLAIYTCRLTIIWCGYEVLFEDDYWNNSSFRNDFYRGCCGWKYDFKDLRLKAGPSSKVEPGHWDRITSLLTFGEILENLPPSEELDTSDGKVLKSCKSR